MTNDLRLLVVDDTVASLIAMLTADLGITDIAVDRADLARQLAFGHTWDIALVDLRWQRPSRDEGFDGIDAISMIDASRLCPRVLLITEAGPSYRHWIEEASRFDVVKGAICKMPDDLSAIIRKTVGGASHWDVLLPRPRAEMVIDLLGRADRPTLFGRFILAIAEGARDYQAVAGAAYVSRQTVKNKMPELLARLVDIGELPVQSGQDKPQTAIWGWVGRNGEYLRSWARRVTASQ
jgi:hypothetical protein